METIGLRIKKVEVFTGGAQDRVVLTTDLPLDSSPMSEGQTLEFKVAAGKGSLYVQKHFNINPKVIKA